MPGALVVMDLGWILRAGGVLEAVCLDFVGESREGCGGGQRKFAAWARREYRIQVPGALVVIFGLLHEPFTVWTNHQRL